MRDYFERVLDQRLEASGRVTFMGRHELLGHKDGTATMRDLETGSITEVVVRRRVVDARYQEASIPATHTPSFTVDADASFMPIGALPARVGDFRRFTVIGAGKTSADACLWLLDAGVDPDHIRWIRPRDLWFIDRAQMQPLDQVAALMEGAADEAEAGAQARDVDDLMHRLEAMGRLMRLDPSTEPRMYRVTMLSRAELSDLQTITDVVRLGRVRTVGREHLELDQGEVGTDPGEAVIDCSARGLAPSPARPVFAHATITLQQVRHASPTFNAALIAYLEARRDHDRERNRLSPPNPYPSTPGDMTRMLPRTWMTAELWRSEPDLQRWIGSSRLNLTRGIAERKTDPRVRAAVNQFVSNVEQATRRMPALAD